MTGAMAPLTMFSLLTLLALAIWRRAKPVRAPFAVLVACVALAPRPSAAADPGKEGLYAGVDFGLSMLEPRSREGGYVIDDDQSTGFRVMLGYAWSEHWSAEGFFADGGAAGVSSDNPAVGHLGEIDYRMVGVGAEWLPLGKGRAARFFPLLKLGVVQITNSTDSDEILYEKLNDTGFYVGGGAGLRLGRSWLAQAEVVSYDADELFVTLGLRKHF